MYDFEATNAEQLVTRTDVVLRGNLAKLRTAALARGSRSFSVAARFAAVRSEIRSAGAHEDRTVFVRKIPRQRPMVLCCAVAAAAWLCVFALSLHL